MFALKKWEVVAHDGKETFKIIANIEMYWTDDRMIGFPTHHKPMPENIWRPRLNGCAGFDLGKAENYEQLPRFYGYDSTQEHKPSDGRMAQTFPVNLKDGFDISADMERFKSFPFDSTRVDLSIVFFGVKRPEWDKDVRLSLRRPNNESCVKKYASQYQHIDVDGASTHSNDYELAGISVAIGQNPSTTRFKNDPRFWDGDMTPCYFISFHIKRSSTLRPQRHPAHATIASGFTGYALEPATWRTEPPCAPCCSFNLAVQWTTVGHPAVAVQDGDGLRLRERLLGADAHPGGRLRITSRARRNCLATADERSARSTMKPRTGSI